MSQVYLAHDGLLDRRVAIKVLRVDSGFARPEERRLLREAQAIARLQHPNIIAVHDVGSVDGRTFVAMEFIAGRTLRQWARSDAPDPLAVAEVMHRAAEGIAAAHAASLLHRDIKPDNLMLADDGRVLVLDFGLARGSAATGNAVAGTQLVDTVLTRPDLMLGTPRYAAPELLMGEPASPATDQYAFGVALYELLLGRPPFAGDTAASMYASQREGPSLAGCDLPASLVQLLERALAFDPDRRLPDMAVLCDILERIVHGPRRRKRRVRAAAIAVGLVVAGTTGFFAAGAQPRPAPSAMAEPHVEQVERLSEQATQAAASARFVYPPPSDPAAATAILKVLELEALSGPGMQLAAEHASTLRTRFADALEALGDRYWDRPGGKMFSADFYVQALLFAPDRQHSRDRATVTVAELALMRQRATTGGFSAGELHAGQVMAALAEPDAQTRRQRVEALLQSGGPALTTTTAMKLRKVVGAKAPDPVLRQPDDVATLTPPPEQDAAPQAPSGVPSANVEKRDKNAAKRLVAQAQTAAAGRRFDEAARLFHQALAHDRGSSRARIGLSHVEYERGRYSDAVRYARLAIKASPQRADYHLQLGDALYKTLRYTQARTAYETANKLGNPKAQARLDRLQKRAGG